MLEQSTRNDCRGLTTLALSRSEALAHQQAPSGPASSGSASNRESANQSYKGSGRLAVRKALIIGGDSGIVAQLLSRRLVRGRRRPQLFQTEGLGKEVVELIKAAGQTAVALHADIRTLVRM
jgi:hypothetical protein